jgi:hypothetical protein
MNVKICDVEGCEDYAEYTVKVLEGDFLGLDFDTCSTRHIQKYIDDLEVEVSNAKDD